jgi:two-component system CheB/CheR fusion protein
MTAPADVEPDGMSTNSLPFPMVGIGASAGGFESVMKLLKILPPDTGMAFVVVLHLDPRHESKLTELVARATPMPTVEIKDEVAPEPNHIYVLPANRDVILHQRRLRLVRRPDTERLHMPVDHFFSSLAQEQGSRAIGVVLSGTGSDGTAGLVAIKGEAGITMAEAESSAKYFGMPLSAIDAGCVDAVLTAEELAKELARIASHPFVRPRQARKSRAGTTAFPESIDALGKIFFLLKHHSDVDFSLYKQNTLKRRISRRMVLRRLERVEEYVSLLRSNTEELEALFHDLLINVTGFFRDPKVYALLKKLVIPKIIKSKGHDDPIRVWVPGCSTGEEVYSLAICLQEEVSRLTRNIKIQIFGTDLSEPALARARTGIYSGSIVKDVSPDRLRRFFTRVNQGYQINRSVRDLCPFARQNICEDPPFSRLDFISCRNVLIYLGPDLQKRCIPVFHYALNPGGFLLLGPSETIGGASDLFFLLDKKCKVYSRRSVARSANLEFATRTGLAERPQLFRPDVSAPPQFKKELDFQKQADRILLDHCVPCGVIVDRQLRILEFRGHTSRFLEHPPGSANLSLLALVHPSLVIDVRTTVHKALKNQTPVHKNGAVLKTNKGSETVDIQAIPFTVPPSDESFLIVLFKEPAAADAGPAPARGSAGAVKGRKSPSRGRPSEVERLQAEVDATKESLQAIIEEQEATNEELKSANEEIESSNEELQSTNEELETAKEELQSANEELTTLNEELSNRNQEMAQVNNDLTNLLSSINIPIIMVDNAGAIRNATPTAERLFNLISSDIGRRLSDLNANLSIRDFDHMIQEVIDTLKVVEAKVQDDHGRWYSLRIRPYRTRDNKIDGAVITLLDVDEELRSIARLEAACHFSEEILDLVHQPMLVLDAQLRIQKASRSFCEAFRLSRKGIENVPLFELDNGSWNVPLFRTMLEDSLPTQNRIKDFQVRFPKLSRHSWKINAGRIGGVDPKDELVILLTFEAVPATDEKPSP